eukprot:6188577-Pleurochrysis_carterae.AAC.2
MEGQGHAYYSNLHVHLLWQSERVHHKSILKMNHSGSMRPVFAVASTSMAPSMEGRRDLPLRSLQS